jgi:hypothetical protein
MSANIAQFAMSGYPRQHALGGLRIGQNDTQRLVYFMDQEQTTGSDATRER